LSEQTHQPVYTASAEKIIGSFISPDGTIATFPVPPAGVISTSPADQLVNYYSMDDIQSGNVTLRLYDLTHDERYHMALDFMYNQVKQHPRTSEGGFWHKGRYPFQMWLDGLYMGEPFYAGYAKRFQKTADFDDIANQFRLITLHTYDPATGLLYHGWDEKKEQPWANKETGTSASFWGRAIGWYAMALDDVLDDMPADHPARPALIADLNQVAVGILKYQDPQTGVWWQVVDKGGQPDNYLEASASSMFVYALAKGVNQGYLPRTDIPAIHTGYQGLIQTFVSTGPDGGVNLNQCCKVATLSAKALGTYEYYTKGEPIVSNDLKGVGPFINAGIECNRLFGSDTFAEAPSPAAPSSP
jgi:unsaturated rhamnogalacturonyl hydrolase